MDEKYFNGTVWETTDTLLIRVYALCYMDSVARESLQEQVKFLEELAQLGVTDIVGMEPEMIREKYIKFELPYEVIQ